MTIAAHTPSPTHTLSITLGMSIGLTAVTLIVERNEGLIDRTWVAGVNATEIILAQVVTQLCILVVQITLMVTVIVYGFKVGLYSCMGGAVCMHAVWQSCRQ